MSVSSAPDPLADARNAGAQAVLEALSSWAQETPGASAICAYDPNAVTVGEWTYSDLASAVSRTARVLRERFDADETVLLRAPNGFEYVAWLLAGLRAGVRVAAVHPLSTDHEITRIALTTRARAIIGLQPFAQLEHLRLADWAAPSADGHAPASPPAQGSVILQSSGVSGAPKLAMRTLAALDADARGLVEAASLTRDDGVLVVVPLSHSYGVDLLVATVFAGASLHVLERFEPAPILRLLDRGIVTVLPGVPFMFEALARPGSSPSLGSLRLAISAGSSLPERVYHEIQSRCGLRVGQLYGATELGTVALAAPDTPDFDWRSVGTPVPGASFRVVAPDAHHDVLPTNAEGELAVMAPSMFAGYLDGASLLADGHFLTGDLGRIDERGRIYVTGRLKHLIDVGGMKVNPLEVEQVFGDHPGIAECALAPVPLSHTVVRLRLLYVPRAGVSVRADDLRDFARSRLSAHKLPRLFEPVAALPRSPAGKLLRHLLSQA